MARSIDNLLLKGLHGSLGKQTVIKQYRYGTVVTNFPDMSNVRPSKLQKQKRSVFSEAVAYAQSILRDPAKKAAYQKKIGNEQTVYHAAIKEYLANVKFQG